MAQHQIQCVAIERADIDLAGKQRVDDAPRGRQWPDALVKKFCAALPIIRQKVMPQRVIAGMGIFHRISDALAKRVFQREVAGIGSHKKMRGVERPPGLGGARAFAVAITVKQMN